MTNHTVRLITTGGTIDKRYQPLSGALGFEQSQVPGVLETAGVTVPVSHLMALDSLDMQDKHRDEILTCCVQSPESRLVVTHGTDTMVETAAVLAKGAPGKTIVLTGAMVPLSVSGSDGAFNLGFALGSAAALPAGVWVAMNGVARPWDNVRKDRERGVFTEAGGNPG